MQITGKRRDGQVKSVHGKSDQIKTDQMVGLTLENVKEAEKMVSSGTVIDCVRSREAGDYEFKNYYDISRI